MPHYVQKELIKTVNLKIQENKNKYGEGIWVSQIFSTFNLQKVYKLMSKVGAPRQLP